VVPDETPRSVAAKLLDQPDLLEALRTSFAGRPVFIEPWNVTKDEVDSPFSFHSRTPGN
jgi:hypothetical protein